MVCESQASTVPRADEDEGAEALLPRRLIGSSELVDR